MTCYRTGARTLTSGGEPLHLESVLVEAEAFQVLGVPAFAGRVFTQEEDVPGRETVALISRSLWRTGFASAPALIGIEIVLDGGRYTVRGVMPPGPPIPGTEADLWTPAAFTSREMPRWQSHYLQVIGRLATGVAVPTAREQNSKRSRRSLLKSTRIRTATLEPS